MARADGSGERRVTRPALLAFAPEWRPDGGRIAFASDLYGDRPFGSIYTISANGADVVRVTHPPFPSTDSGPSYAPGGDRLVFESDRAYPDGCCHSLFIVDADGTGLTAVPLPWDAYDTFVGPGTGDPGRRAARPGGGGPDSRVPIPHLRAHAGGRPPRVLHGAGLIRRRRRTLAPTCASIAV